MSRHRFYAPPTEITGSSITLSPDETHHLARVLRLRPGDQVSVFNGLGAEYSCTVDHVSGNQATLEIIEQLTDAVESPLPLTLAQALAKGEKFDFIVQKATELGVRRIVPIVTEQSDVRLADERAGRRLERWRRVPLELVLSLHPSPAQVTAIVGPEGGWSDAELRAMTEFGCQTITLGPRTLR